MLLTKRKRGKLISARREVAEQGRIRRGLERNLARQLVSVFDKIADRAAEQYDYGGFRAINRTAVIQDLAAVIVPSVRATMNQMVARFSFIDPKQSPYERFIEQYINTQVGSHIQNIENTTLNQIRRAIEEGALEDLGPAGVSQRIRNRVGGSMGRRRAITIARTETHSAASYANHAVATESGVALKKRWVSTNDDRTRQHHRLMNGVEVGADEDFTVPYKGINYKMGYAGDPRGGAANVINCRCVIVYFEDDDVIIDDPVTERVPEAEFAPTQVQPEAVIEEKPFIDLSPIFAPAAKKSKGVDAFNNQLNAALTLTTAKVAAALPKPSLLKEANRGYHLDGAIVSHLRYGTLEHEYGHMIDYHIGKRKGSLGYWSDDGLKKEFQTDRKALNLHKKAERDAVLTQFRRELFVGEEKTHRGRKYINYEPKFAGASEVSDIIDAMVGGYFRKVYNVWGHSISYWRRRTYKEKETFANLFSLQNKPEALEFVRKHFPELQNRFEQAMEELAETGDIT